MGCDPSNISTIHGAPTIANQNANQKIVIENKIWSPEKQIKPYFLTVGSLEPRKNFSFALNAFLLAAQHVDIELVVIGSLVDPYKVYFQNEISKLGLKNVIFTGFLSEADLIKAYTKSSGLLFFSELEGLGLPALEAMNYGCPALVSNESSLPEIVGTSELVFKQDEQIKAAETMIKLVNDLVFKENVVIKGKRQAEIFNWDKTIEKTVTAWAKHWDLFKYWTVDDLHLRVLEQSSKEQEKTY